jgi:hypothetical protein
MPNAGSSGTFVVIASDNNGYFSASQPFKVNVT